MSETELVTEQNCLHGQVAALRRVLRRQWRREPLSDEWQAMGPFGKEGEYRKCAACGGDSRIPDRSNPFGPVKHHEDCPWLLCKEVLTSDIGKSEAEVIAAAVRYEDMNRQYRALDSDNLRMHDHYRDILLEDRAKASKDMCEAVKRMRERE